MRSLVPFRDDPPHPRIIIAFDESGRGQAHPRAARCPFSSAAEIVDDDNRTPTVPDPLQLGLHDTSERKEGDVSASPPNLIRRT